MKVFVATSRTQGQRTNDFDFVPDGELLYRGWECDGEDVDGSCGCRRCMSGIVCCKGTTTFTVVDIPITWREYSERLMSIFIGVGWGKLMSEVEMRQEADKEVIALDGLANEFPVGVVLEKRGDVIQVRSE